MTDIAQTEQEERPRHLSENQLPPALTLSNRLSGFVDLVGRFGSWFLVPLVLITTFDATLRFFFSKQQPWLVENVSFLFGSTILQELEWHVHTINFTLVLAYGYIWNTHVRVDLLRENLAFKKKAWIEFIGLTFFFIPYCVVLLYFAAIYAFDSYMINEASASLVGLSHRWMIKSVLVMGIFVVIVAGIAVWLQVAMVLFGPQNIRFPLMTIEWPEEEGSKIEGKERLDLSKTEDMLEVRAKSRKREEQPAE